MWENKRGFTLIELVITMTIVGIVAAVSVSFISRTTEQTLSVSQRQQGASVAGVMSATLSRALQNALPNSIRITPDGRCLEYIPILAGTTYTDLAFNQPVSTFKVLGVNRAVTGRVVVYPLANTNVYLDWKNTSHVGSVTNTTETLASGSSEVTVNLSANHQFNTAPAVERIYWAGSPVAICQQGKFVYEYRNYTTVSDINNLSAALPNTHSAGRSVLAYPMDASQPLAFEYLPATLTRNGLVRFEYYVRLTLDQASQRYGQEVHIKNVP